VGETLAIGILARAGGNEVAGVDVNLDALDLEKELCFAGSGADADDAFGIRLAVKNGRSAVEGGEQKRSVGDGLPFVDRLGTGLKNANVEEFDAFLARRTNG